MTDSTAEPAPCIEIGRVVSIEELDISVVEVPVISATG